MPEVWDTSLASKIHSTGAYGGLLRTRAKRNDPVVLTAPTVLETVRGLALRASGDPSLGEGLRWYTRILGSRLVRVLAFDTAAAVLAGQLRARQELPPPRRRGDTRGKPQRRVAWVLDTQIAATAWTAGYGVATENRSDFELLRRLIDALHPGAPPLEVVGPPEF